MSIRDKLKNVKSEEPEGEGFQFDFGPQWSTGDDVPITWKKKELKRLRKKTLRDNYKRGVISKQLYKEMLKG